MKPLVEEILPEWEAFASAVRDRRPDSGTWCEAWTVRDLVIHQAGNAEELARVLGGHLADEPVPTRSFEEREGPYRAMSDEDLWLALLTRIEELSEVLDTAARDLEPDEDVAWTGRTMKPPHFAEHMREELVLHRWDIAGDDSTANSSLGERWLTEHSVVAVGRPLLARGASTLDRTEPIEGRLRVYGDEDVVVSLGPDGTSIFLAEPEGPATLESDAAARCLLLWGRRPSDGSRWRSGAGPERLRWLRRLLSGY